MQTRIFLIFFIFYPNFPCHFVSLRSMGRSKKLNSWFIIISPVKWKLWMIYNIYLSSLISFSILLVMIMTSLTTVISLIKYAFDEPQYCKPRISWALYNYAHLNTRYCAQLVHLPKNLWQ